METTQRAVLSEGAQRLAIFIERIRPQLNELGWDFTKSQGKSWFPMIPSRIHSAAHLSSRRNDGDDRAISISLFG